MRGKMNKVPYVTIKIALEFSCRNINEVLEKAKASSIFHQIIFEDEMLRLDTSKLKVIKDEKILKKLYDSMKEFAETEDPDDFGNSYFCEEIIQMLNCFPEKVSDLLSRYRKFADNPDMVNYLNANLRSLSHNNFCKFMRSIDYKGFIFPYIKKEFTEPKKKLIEFLKKTKGKIHGSFALSMFTKNFEPGDIDIFFDNFDVYCTEIQNLLECYSVWDYCYNKFSALYVMYTTLFGYTIKYILIGMPSSRFISLFDMECCRINWNPNLENPFSENPYHLLRRIELRKTCYFSIFNIDDRRITKYTERGFDVVSIKFNYKKPEEGYVFKNCIYVETENSPKICLPIRIDSLSGANSIITDGEIGILTEFLRRSNLKFIYIDNNGNAKKLDTNHNMDFFF